MHIARINDDVTQLHEIQILLMHFKHSSISINFLDCQYYAIVINVQID